MKTAEEILRSKLDPSVAIVNKPDYTFNKVIIAMEEYANQQNKELIEALIGTAKALNRMIYKHDRDSIESEWIGEANEALFKATGKFLGTDE